jgi:hypothetical protein
MAGRPGTWASPKEQVFERRAWVRIAHEVLANQKSIETSRAQSR